MARNDNCRGRYPYGISHVGVCGKFLALILLSIANVCLAETNWWSDLHLRKELIISIHRFTGSVKGDYFEPEDMISSQIVGGLGGRPNPVATLPDGSRLLSASRPHSGDEKAAVVIDANVNVLAAAVISFGCHYAETNHAGGKTPQNIASRRMSCHSEPKLTVFEREKPNTIVLAALLEWARSYAKDIQYEERVLQ